MKLDTLNIENLIDSGNFYKARKIVALFLKIQNNSLESRLTVAEFFFHLNDFKSALKYISLKELFETETVGIQNTLIKEKSLVFAARTLNVLGAFNFAVQIINSLKPEYHKKFSNEIAGIYMTNNYFNKALSYYENAVSINGNQDVHHGFQPIIARCHTGNNNFFEAEKIAKHYFSLISTDLNVDRKAPLHAILGEIYLNSNQLELAQHHLEIANSMYKNLPNSKNIGYAQMWLAACYGLMGLNEKSEILFKSCWKLLYLPGHQPNIWLKIFYWKGLIEFNKTGLFNSYWKKIITYPEANSFMLNNTINEQFLIMKIQNYIKIPDNLYVSINELYTNKFNNADIEFAFDNNTDNFNCYRQSLTLNLEKILIQSGPEGIPIFKACEILWPNQAPSILSLLKRLEQLIIQVNTPVQKIKTEKNHLIYLDNSKILKWSKNPIDTSEIFLNQNSQFTRESVQSFFKLSKSKAAEICKKWIDENLTIKVNKGKKTFYQVCK